MLKFKKALSALLAISMLGASATQAVFADSEETTTPSYTTAFEDYSYNWDVKYANKDGKSIFDEDDIFACITDYVAHSGEHSYYVRHYLYEKQTQDDGTEKNVAPYNWSAISLDQSMTLTQGEYTVTFYAKGWINGTFNSVIFSGGTWSPYDFNTFTESTADANGWKKFTKEITIDEKGATKIGIACNGEANNLFIDDISVTDSTGKEYVKNGGFEEKYVPTVAYQYKTEFADYDAGWTSEAENITNDGNGNEGYGCVTDEHAKSGSYSYLMRNIGDSNKWKMVSIRQDFASAGSVGVYTIKFALYGTYDNGPSSFAGKEFDYDGTQYNKLRVYCKDDENADTYIEMNIKYDSFWTQDGDWKVFTFTLNGTELTARTGADGAKTSPVSITGIGFGSQGYTRGLYIDDISMKDANGKEYVTNGGFETKVSYELKNLICYETTEQGLNFVWQNPSKALDSVEIEVDGNAVSTSAASLAASAWNEVRATGLQEGKRYIASVKGIKNGETVYSKEFTGVMGGTSQAVNYAGTQALGDWNFVRKENLTDKLYANTVASIDYNDKSEGSSSIKLTGYIPQYQNNVFPHVAQTVVNLKKNTKYQLTFDAKLNNVGWLKCYAFAKDGDNALKTYDYQPNTDFATTGWKTYTLVLDDANYDMFAVDDETYDIEFNIGVMSMKGSLNIDNVCLYALNDDDKPTGENLLSNGGFEFGCEVEEAVFTKDGSVIRNIEAGTITVTSAIRNRNMGADFSAAIIYALYNNNQLVSIFGSKQGVLTASTTNLPGDSFSASVTINEITEDDDYEIKAFYWDGMNTIKPLKPADVLN